MRRVALLGDVHGNAVALAAVLEELRREEPDLVVWTGDLSWGWEPAATLALVRALGLPARYVRGNAERALLELRAGDIAEEQLVEIIEKPPRPRRCRARRAAPVLGVAVREGVSLAFRAPGQLCGSLATRIKNA